MMYSLYDAEGRIFMQFERPLGESDLLGYVAGMIKANGAAGCINTPCNMGTHYVSAGQVLTRPESPAQLQASTLTNLPVPCEIRINDAVYDCAEAEAELDLAGAPSYSVRVRAWPYLDKEWTIEDPAS